MFTCVFISKRSGKGGSQGFLNFIRQASSCNAAMGDIFGKPREKRCTEDEVVKMATEDQEHTYLWLNDGRVFKNSGKHSHAETAFMKSAGARQVTEIRIKNSSCSNCARNLVRFYNDSWILYLLSYLGIVSMEKPTIYVGSIYRKKTGDVVAFDDDGLKILLRERFTLKVWEKMHSAMHPNSRQTYRILERAKAEVREEQNNQYTNSCVIL